MIPDLINPCPAIVRKKYKRSFKRCGEVQAKEGSIRALTQNPCLDEEDGRTGFRSNGKSEFGRNLVPGRFRNGMFESNWNGDEMTVIGEESSADSFVLETSNSECMNYTTKMSEEGEDCFGSVRSCTKDFGRADEETLAGEETQKRSIRYPKIFVSTNLRRESKRNSCKSVHSDDSTPHLYIDYEERLKSLLLSAFPDV